MSVNCYILISGYFLIKASIEKFFKFIIPIIFYSVALYLFISIYNNEFSVASFIKSFFPIRSGGYWFVATYILLFLVSPLLNRLIKILSFKQLQSVIMVGLLFIVLYPTLTPFTLTGHDLGHGLISFSLLYLIGHYLRFYDMKNPLLIYLGSCFLLFLLNILENCITSSYGIHTHWNNYDDCLVYLSAISFFCYFKKKEFKSSFINYISPSFFFVYIIHENNYVRPQLYIWLGNLEYINSPLWVVHAIGCMILVFVVCLCIDLTRRRLLSKYIEQSAIYCAKISKSILSHI